MAKLLPILAVFALSLNLFSGMLIGTGAAAGLGISPEVGGDDSVTDSTEQAQDFRSGSPTGSTLFGMYNAVVNVLKTLVAPVTALPNMLNMAGVPGAITGMLKVILAVIYAMGTISLLRGYSLN